MILCGDLSSISSLCFSSLRIPSLLDRTPSRQSLSQQKLSICHLLSNNSTDQLLLLSRIQKSKGKRRLEGNSHSTMHQYKYKVPCSLSMTSLVRTSLVKNLTSTHKTLIAIWQPHPGVHNPRKIGKTKSKNRSFLSEHSNLTGKASQKSR